MRRRMRRSQFHHHHHHQDYRAVYQTVLVKVKPPPSPTQIQRMISKQELDQTPFLRPSMKQNNTQHSWNPKAFIGFANTEFWSKHFFFQNMLSGLKKKTKEATATLTDSINAPSSTERQHQKEKRKSAAWCMHVFISIANHSQSFWILKAGDDAYIFL